MAYEVRSFLFKISEKLSTKESNALVSIYELPARLRDQSALDVILQLEMQGKYNKLEELAKIFKNLNRNDLAKEINTFAKKNKKRQAHTRQEDRGVANANLKCVLEVTKLQHDILSDQIAKLWGAADEAGQRRIQELVEELTSINDQMNKKIHQINSVLPGKHAAEFSLSPSSSISSTSSNGEETTVNPLETEIHAKQQKSHSLPRNMPAVFQISAKQPLLPPPVKNKPVQCTEAHTPQPAAGGPQNPVKSHAKRPQVHMTPPTKALVQKTKLKPTPAPKPAVKPKPRVTASLQPPKDNRQQPVGSVPTPKTAVVHISEGNDDDDYSELTYGGTGDSGFAEAGEFLRPELRRHPAVQPQEQLPPGEYADLNTTTKEPERYYKSTRNCPQMEAIRGIMVDQTANNDDSDHNPDPEYMNVRR